VGRLILMGVFGLFEVMREICAQKAKIYRPKIQSHDILVWYLSGAVCRQIIQQSRRKSTYLTVELLVL
jgi:hypothetical protein